MGSDSPSLCVRCVLVVEALPDTDGTGPHRLGVNRTSRRRPCPVRAQYDDEPQSIRANRSYVPSHARETPLVTGPPDTFSKLVIRQTLLGRSTSQLRETGHGAVSSRFRLSCLRSPPFADPPE
jgi:hypothetical protein